MVFATKLFAWPAAFASGASGLYLVSCLADAAHGGSDLRVGVARRSGPIRGLSVEAYEKYEFLLERSGGGVIAETGSSGLRQGRRQCRHAGHRYGRRQGRKGVDGKVWSDGGFSPNENDALFGWYGTDRDAPVALERFFLTEDGLVTGNMATEIATIHQAVDGVHDIPKSELIVSGNQSPCVVLKFSATGFHIGPVSPADPLKLTEAQKRRAIMVESSNKAQWPPIFTVGAAGSGQNLIFTQMANLLAMTTTTTPCGLQSFQIFADPRVSYFENNANESPKYLPLFSDESAANATTKAYMRTFDHQLVGANAYDSGDFWQMKSESVYSQGRFGFSGEIKLDIAAVGSVAFGGQFLGGSILVVESLDDGATVPERSWSRPAGDASVQEKGDVGVQFPVVFRPLSRRFDRHIDVKVTMPRKFGGIDGQSGNFDRLAENDGEQSLMELMGDVTVHDGFLLVDGKLEAPARTIRSASVPEDEPEVMQPSVRLGEAANRHKPRSTSEAPLVAKTLAANVWCSYTVAVTPDGFAKVLRTVFLSGVSLASYASTMRLCSFLSAWSCLLLSLFHLIVESQSFQIRVVGGEDDDPELVNASVVGPAQNWRLTPAQHDPVRNRTAGNAFGIPSDLKREPPIRVVSGEDDEPELLNVSGVGSAQKRGLTPTEHDPIRNRTAGIAFGILGDPKRSPSIRVVGGEDDDPELVNASGVGPAQSWGVTPAEHDAVRNRTVGNAFGILGDLTRNPPDPNHLTAFLASSAAGPVIALVVCSVFFCSLLWFVCAELVSDDETQPGESTSYRPKLQGPGMPSTQSEQPATIGPRSPGSFLQSQRQSVLSSTPSEASVHTNTHRERSLIWERGSAVGSEMPGRPSTVAGTLPALLCADLALPECDTWFGLSLAALDSVGSSVQAGGKNLTVPVLGLQGKPLLFANVVPGMLSLTVKPGTGCVGQLQEIPGGCFHILDKNSRVYGTFQCIGPSTYQVIYGRQEQMRLAFDANTCQMILTSSADGGTLACAGKSADRFQANERLEVCVVAGMDPVLSLLCIVGPMVLSPTRREGF